MNRLLLVEDDFQIREIIEDYFSSKSDEFEITSAIDGFSGLDYIKNYEFDLVMLDVMLPHIDGFTICREIRKNSDVPILFLTARTREEDVLYGYELGCDDYIGKPFSLSRLHAKVNALLNRSRGTVVNDSVVCGKIRINKRTLEVFADGQSIYLAPKEFALLNYLIVHKNWVISRETLITNLWKDDDIVDRVVDNHIKKLRKALGPAGNQIKTVISKGYKITD
ncbi:MAG: response regulator transcription factor [Thermoflexaceae bacterium]|nr:response regulator transcription factor [Thermoflexaceae bacterium]